MSKLWLLSFALEQPGSPCEHVLVGEGASFDAAFAGERAAGTVPEGQWDVVGYEIPLSVRQFQADKVTRGMRFTEGEAARLFGPRRIWDWRARPGTLRAKSAMGEAPTSEGPQRYGVAVVVSPPPSSPPSSPPGAETLPSDPPAAETLPSDPPQEASDESL